MLYWLETARKAGGNQNTVTSTAQAAACYAWTKGANADRLATLWDYQQLELAARFYNLEAIPARQNLAKSAKLTEREINLARRWNREGPLSNEGLAAIEKAGIAP